MRKRLAEVLLGFSLGGWLIHQGDEILERAVEVWLRPRVRWARPSRPKTSDRCCIDSSEQLQARPSTADIPICHLPQWQGVQPVQKLGPSAPYDVLFENMKTRKDL